MPIVLMPIENIIAENYNFCGAECDPEIMARVDGCYSSFYYYDTLREKIASIVVSLVKNHYFPDGNKRTALSVYIALAEVNRLTHVANDEELADLFVEIAISHKSMDEYAKMLFPET